MADERDNLDAEPPDRSDRIQPICTWIVDEIAELWLTVRANWLGLAAIAGCAIVAGWLLVPASDDPAPSPEPVPVAAVAPPPKTVAPAMAKVRRPPQPTAVTAVVPNMTPPPPIAGFQPPQRSGHGGRARWGWYALAGITCVIVLVAVQQKKAAA